MPSKATEFPGFVVTYRVEHAVNVEGFRIPEIFCMIIQFAATLADENSSRGRLFSSALGDSSKADVQYVYSFIKKLLEYQFLVKYGCGLSRDTYAMQFTRAFQAFTMVQDVYTRISESRGLTTRRVDLLRSDDTPTSVLRREVFTLDCMIKCVVPVIKESLVVSDKNRALVRKLSKELNKKIKDRDAALKISRGHKAEKANREEEEALGVLSKLGWKLSSDRSTLSKS